MEQKQSQMGKNDNQNCSNAEQEQSQMAESEEISNHVCIIQIVCMHFI